jgi:hypothetical protein
LGLERRHAPVSRSAKRVTTINLPGPIAAIDAVGVTADEKTPGQIQLAHAKGSSFLSVRALARKVANQVRTSLSPKLTTAHNSLTSRRMKPENQRQEAENRQGELA